MKPVRRPRHTYVDNMKVNLRKKEWGCMAWIDLAEDRNQWKALVNKVMKFWFSQNVEKSLSA
jgi:hypothetical protein